MFVCVVPQTGVPRWASKCVITSLTTSSSLTLRHDGSMPSSITVQYHIKSHSSSCGTPWVNVTTQSTSQTLTLNGLRPGAWYEVRLATTGSMSYSPVCEAETLAQGKHVFILVSMVITTWVLIKLCSVQLIGNNTISIKSNSFLFFSDKDKNWQLVWLNDPDRSELLIWILFEPPREKTNLTPENSILRYFHRNVLLWPNYDVLKTEPKNSLKRQSYGSLKSRNT